MSRPALARAVQLGHVVGGHGVYCLPSATQATVTAQMLSGVRSHRSAAEHWGFALPPGSEDVDVIVPFAAQRRRVPTGVRLHYRDLSTADIVDGVTSPTLTVVHCLRELSFREALSVGDSALRLGKVDHSELRARVRSLRGPGSAIARQRFALLDARAANGFESCCRAILIAAGVTGFTPQVNITHEGEWIGRADLADRRRFVVIECDGYATHGTPEGWRRDCIRHTRFVAAGWRPLRFTWGQVMYEPDWVLACVLATIALAETA